MKIAYLILAHNTPNHLGRLVRALDSPNAAFFIHVDRKADIALFRDRLSQPNVTFLEDRIALYWGEFPIVPATIELIKKALSVSLQPDYLCLLSGSDYPLRSPDYIEGFFSRNKVREFINLAPIPCEAVGKPIGRVQDYWLQTPFNHPLATRVVCRLNILMKEKLRVKRNYARVFKGLLPYAGSTWWALTSNACRHILTFVDFKPDVVKFFRNIYMPDESFFQTIIGNSEFAKHVTRNLTFTDWSRPTGGPAIIDMEHLTAFKKTPRVMADDPYGRGELLFARKFPDDSAQLTDFIEAHLIRRNSNPNVSTISPAEDYSML